MAETWGSSCHGAGRMLSRTAAIKRGQGRNIRKELEARGVVVMSTERDILAEEMPEAYKDVSAVVTSSSARDSPGAWRAYVRSGS